KVMLGRVDQRGTHGPGVVIGLDVDGRKLRRPEAPLADTAGLPGQGMPGTKRMAILKEGVWLRNRARAQISVEPAAVERARRQPRRQQRPHLRREREGAV